MRRTITLLMVLALGLTAGAKEKEWTLASPDGRLEARIVNDEGCIYYFIAYDGDYLITAASIGLRYTTGDNAEQWHTAAKKVSRRTIDETIVSPFSRQTSMRNHCNEMTMYLKKDLSIVFRAYNEGFAYRFVWEGKPGKVNYEMVDYNFARNWNTTAAYVSQFDSTRHDVQYSSSFESQYKTLQLTELDPRRLCFLPSWCTATMG